MDTSVLSKKKNTSHKLRGEVKEFRLDDDGKFPNSKYPVILYKQALNLPKIFPCLFIRQLFRKNKWMHAWKSGIFEYHHYHSITHEVVGICRGKTTLLLGGEKGVKIEVEAGDVLIIPAGVAHKNEGNEKDITCIGAYPQGFDYDMRFGHIDERPAADDNIRRVPVPDTDPVYGRKFGVHHYWRP